MIERCLDHFDNISITDLNKSIQIYLNKLNINNNLLRVTLDLYIDSSDYIIKLFCKLYSKFYPKGIFISRLLRIHSFEICSRKFVIIFHNFEIDNLRSYIEIITSRD